MLHLFKKGPHDGPFSMFSRSPWVCRDGKLLHLRSKIVNTTGNNAFWTGSHKFDLNITEINAEWEFVSLILFSNHNVLVDEKYQLKDLQWKFHFLLSINM